MQERTWPSSTKVRQAELMQSRTPLGGGPSRNRCPRCSPHRLQTSSLLLLFCTASEAMSGRPEEVVKGTPSMVLEKAGQPEPDSYMSSRGRSDWSMRSRPQRSVDLMA